MNSFGRIFRVSIFGESHGAVVGVVLDGCIPGIAISEADFMLDLDRRRGGTREGTTPRMEADQPEILSGVFKGTTTGAPLMIQFRNTSVRSEDYDSQRAIPRPGHADFVAGKKFGGFEDYRGGGHFSGRLTVCLVAAGVVAKKILQALAPEGSTPISSEAVIKTIGGESNPEKGIAEAVKAQDSVGGIIECTTHHVPLGLGEPFFDSAESLISHAVFSIPAIRGIEFGTGFAAASMKGSLHNDALMDETGQTSSNHSGGIVGGLTNGNPLVFRVAVKPTSSTPQTQESYNMETGNVESFKVKGRHDLCIALRVPVVLEAVTSAVLVDLLLLQHNKG
ncbi:MAG: chorismate synthase [Sphingobacteriales bacterium]|nr:chorismate synthase [Sphingobacteriales bacterium]